MNQPSPYRTHHNTIDERHTLILTITIDIGRFHGVEKKWKMDLGRGEIRLFQPLAIKYGKNLGRQGHVGLNQFPYVLTNAPGNP